MLKYDGELIKDENTDRMIGVYKILGATGGVASSGHKLYVAQCTECKHYFIRRLTGFTRDKCFTEVCNHLTRSGQLKRCAGNQYLFKDQKFSRVYRSMIGHCYDKADKDYKMYGAKGVTVCTEWRENPKSFESWCESTYNYELAKKVGDDKVCLILNYLGDGVKEKVYSPETCSWVSNDEAARWKHGTTDITIDGDVLTGKQTALRLNIGQNAINVALRHGKISVDEEDIKRYVNSRKMKSTDKQEIIEAVSKISIDICEYIKSLNINILTLRDVDKIHKHCHQLYKTRIRREFIDNCIKSLFIEYDPDTYFIDRVLYPPYDSCSELHNVWYQMINRCENPKNRDYKYYGAKGVKVCDEWRYDFRKFYDWAMSAGYKRECRESGACWNILTIDRIDPFGDYDPNNCRWATSKEQMQNRRCDKK